MNKKDMDFLQILNRGNISLFGDADRDKVPNVFDCKPLDPNRDGLFGRAINIISLGRFGQSKEDYAAEKFSSTHFERDNSGKVIRVVKNGESVSPGLKSSDQLIQEYNEEKAKAKLAELKAKNEEAKQKIELQKLKAKERELLLAERLQAQRFPKPSATRETLSLILGIPMASNVPLQRQGYYIEASEPKLPKGFKWKKIPKGKSKQNAFCPRCGVPLVPMPGMFGQIVWVCPRCGGM